MLSEANPAAELPAAAAASNTAATPTHAAASSLRYMPGLDVMRGFAIAIVLVYHGIAGHEETFAAIGTPTALALHAVLGYGRLGVHLFFILSGFLITGILIDSRGQPDYYRNFYLRRALRIVPAYLVMLAVLRLTSSVTWRYVVVSLLYFCNMTGLFGARPEYGPLWSLSVEEQFYLTWPFAVRHLSQRVLTRVSLALIVLTPALRLALLYGPVPLRDISYKTWVLVDFFAAGSLLAIAVRTPHWRAQLHRTVAPLVLSGIALFAIVQVMPTGNRFLQNLNLAITLEPWLLIFSGLLLFAYLTPGIARSLWGRPLVFLGSISYGLYLFHQFLFNKIDGYWPLGTTSPLRQMFLRFAVEAAASIAIAWLSRSTFEEFFLRLKPKHRPTPSPA